MRFALSLGEGWKHPSFPSPGRNPPVCVGNISMFISRKSQNIYNTISCLQDIKNKERYIVRERK